ncbi:hypothetical protein [Succinivibrio sp.]|uniref:hypothetical protein n=1 Tax=Succinivibrio sp. TaxID=2053619 RepID=UPI0038692D8F
MGKYKNEVLTATRVLDEHGRIESTQMDIIEMRYAVRPELIKKMGRCPFCNQNKNSKTLQKLRCNTEG